jgi:hypothetical protein
MHFDPRSSEQLQSGIPRAPAAYDMLRPNSAQKIRMCQSVVQNKTADSAGRRNTPLMEV